ncbi:unnamed protein product [Cuscuta epithymum]|uniref:Reverse transcriptase domain-containing protein n=1 Tax=Cuscuta epithymum TaxID=186058 RepID=A0AAV0G9B5_9ASTE|nr:unnamed protein product [Cuscuta epithymum]
MNCLFWNVRGLESSCSRLYSLTQQWRIHILIVIEPIVANSKASNYKSQLGFNEVAISGINKIWVYWSSENVQLSDFIWHEQYVHFKVSSGSFLGWITGIYGDHNYVIRRQLWADLATFSQTMKDPWIVGGDFNSIANFNEHQGRGIPALASIQDFSNCISMCNLVDLPYNGCKYTWTGTRSNGRVWRRLDRCLINNLCLDLFDSIQISHLNSSPSDHNPILIQCSSCISYGPRPFRFQNMWTTHHTFMETVQRSWNAQNHGGGMRGLVRKLQALKKDLRNWNLKTFGNIFADIKCCEAEVLETEKTFEENPSSENREKWSQSRALLMSKYKLEKKFWKQKANIKWLKEGDANTAFFHSFVKIRNKMQTITSINDSDGNLLTSSPDIGAAAVDFFKGLYSVEPEVAADQILQFIPEIITEEDNIMLSSLPEEEEVKKAVWDLNPKGAPGPDGFNGKFFRKCWSIVGKDVTLAVQEFFLGINIPAGFASSWIVLIPKTDRPSSFSEFRPICLSNFVNKVCTKVLAFRLSSILSKIISKEQAGFMKGRDIADQALMAQEMIHAIDKKIRGGNVVIKLDMAKAFDRVSWKFLSDVLKRFGFSARFIMLVMNNLKSTFLSVLVNGSPQGFFKPLRGVKQGDPLSPFLFIIAAEGFSRALNWHMEQGHIKPYWMGNQGFPVSHLGFADDILVFLNGEIRSIIRFKKFIGLYQAASGQAVNLDKSSIVCGKYAERRSRILKDALGMNLSSLPMKYLGVNLHRGINRFNYCSQLISQFEKKSTPWKQKNLSQGGRLILIKHVLNSIPLHTLATDTLPKKVKRILECKMADFFWGSSNHKRKYHWKSWSRLCGPTEEGGLGIRSLTDLEKSFTLKLWWKWKTGNTFWNTFINDKYSREGNIIPKITDSPFWKRICAINSEALSACSYNSSGVICWDLESSGCFTLQSAYNFIREENVSTFAFKQIWHPD